MPLHAVAIPTCIAIVVLAPTILFGENGVSADRLMELAKQQLNEGEIRAAADNLREALESYRDAGDSRGECLALEYLIAITQKTGPVEQMSAYLASASRIEGVPGSCAQNFQVWLFLGDDRASQGKAQEAADAYQHALTLAQEDGNAENEAVALGVLGRTYAMLDETDKAVEYLRRSLERARTASARYIEGAALWELGRLSLGAEDYVAAKSYYWQALVIAQEFREGDKEAEALWQLGNIHYYLGDYRQAIDYQEKSAAVAEEIGDATAQSRAQRSLGSTWYLLGDLSRAARAYEQTLVLARRLDDKSQQAFALGNLALVHLAKGDAAKAVDYLEEDLEILRATGDRQNESQALANLGLAYAELGEIDKAVTLFDAGAAAAEEVGYRRGVGIAKTNLGWAHLKNQDYAAAERELRVAVEAFDTLREPVAATDAFNASLFETHLRTYRHLQAATVAQGKYWAALEAAEMGRARAFSDLLMRRRRGETKYASRQEGALDQAAIADLAATKRSTIVSYSILPEDQTLYTWVVEPSGKLHFAQTPLGDVGKLDELVAESREAIGNATRGVQPGRTTAQGTQASLQKLYSILIEPIAPHLPDTPANELVFVPQGSLFLVPFAALMDPAGTYLVERHSISVAPSIAVLNLTQRNTRAQRIDTRASLVVGNPTVSPPTDGRPGLAPLPGAEREALQVAEALGAGTLIGDEATRERIVQRISSAPVVHLATHGLLGSTVDGVPGAIVLAAGARDDGLLTSADVMDLELAAELVVLSACDTAQGDITGDGVVGLSRSFISAGAPSVIVSLWSIPDGPTASLMTEFYARLAETHDLAAALRAAMLETRLDHPEPGDWAAFTLIGESRW